MATKIHKILIANRGEIAVRIIRTCKRLGIYSTVVFTEPDRLSVATSIADEAIFIGPPSAYLDMDKIIQVSKQARVDAIHPGFGFLSENYEFAEKCEAAGIIFIGPSSFSIKTMGSKIEAKKLLLKPEFRGFIPVIPGYHGDDQSDEVLVTEALKIGFPVLIKASAGGGGKGMRVVRKDSELLSSISSARRESKEAFGSDKLLIERYFESVRHVEIQIMADSGNNCLHLFERDCSIQRRHQKVIEETPSPVMTPDLRHRMGQAAVIIGKAINYKSAGTVEFILDNKKNFYFLEVNTRLQVEHPITEAITGLDLVELQIRIAEGYTLNDLGLSQQSIKSVGHAMQCRLYAEDPLNEFFPSPGKLLEFIPENIEGVRYDSGVQSGSEISIYYDPMIAKVISYGRDRAECLQRMRQALSKSIIIGPTTNQLFLLQVMSHPVFVAGDYNTHFIENHLPFSKREEFCRPNDSMIDHETAIVSTMFFWWLNTERRILQKHVRPVFRNVFYKREFKEFEINGKNYKVEYQLEKTKVGMNQLQFFKLNIGELNYDATIEKHSNLIIKDSFPSSLQIFTTNISCTVNCVKRNYHIYVCGENDIYLHCTAYGRVISVKLLPRLIVSFKKDTDTDSMCRAKMTGTIVSVPVQAGTLVQAGDVLVVMESMKMESKITSPKNGIVEKVFINVGQVVEGGEPLILFKKDENIEKV